MIELKPIQFDLPPFRLEAWDEWKPKLIERLEYASKLNIPHLPQLLPCEGTAVIVGSGPSVVGFEKEIKKCSSGELDLLFSLNGAHEWLIGNVRPPNIHVIFESDIEDISISLGGPPNKAVAYYLCSQCDSKLFEQLEGYRRVLWHVFQWHQEYQNIIAQMFRGEFMVTGGWSTFFMSLYIAVILGYRKFELFGVDCSYPEDGSDHIPGYKTADVEKPYNIWGVDEATMLARRFRSNGSLALQAYEFYKFCEINQSGLSLRVHGDSLLQYIHKSKYPEQYRKE